MTERIVVISDSHGNPDKIEAVLTKEDRCKTIVFCGDGLRDLAFIDLPKDAVLLKVDGNNDFYETVGCEQEILQEVHGRILFIAHGHRHGVKSSTNYIAETARARGANIILFGHTHIPCFIEGDPILFNPGALMDNRYGIIEISDTGDWKFYHKRL